jgi:magnesium transporter
MLTVRWSCDGMPSKKSSGEDVALSPGALWIDLMNPTEVERQRVSEAYGLVLPLAEEIAEIEATSRFFEDDDGVHLRTYFLQELPEGCENATVSFTVRDGRLFTLRYREVPSFDDFLARMRRNPEDFNDPWSVALGLIETRVDRTADLLERLYANVDDHTKSVFGVAEASLERLIDDMAGAEHTNGKARLSLLDKERVLTLLRRSETLSADSKAMVGELLRDTESLLAHSTTLSEKIDFLMDVTTDKIAMEQNRVIRIVSVAALTLLPPTLIASVYGMNFRFMPELAWQLGYPLALVLMLLSGLAPYFYFKRKGWL